MMQTMEYSVLQQQPTMIHEYPGSMVLDCPECGGQMVLRMSYKFNKPFYGCLNFPHCRCAHGAHPDGRPLGKPADTATKRWRILAHAALDPLWGRDDSSLHKQIQNRYRRAVYAWLGDQLGIANVGVDCHIGLFDAARCQQVIDACKDATRQQILNWHAARFPQPKKKHRRPPRYAHY